MKKLNVVMFAACILCGLLAYSAAIRAVINRYELPRKVVVISRNEHVQYTYDGNAKIVDDSVIVYDAVLVDRMDLKKFVE